GEAMIVQRFLFVNSEYYRYLLISGSRRQLRFAPLRPRRRSAGDRREIARASVNMDPFSARDNA
ncbi:hypothetical protein, partial [Burkholderia sp. SIMBA_062]|uniref:hypothetical protein n=1 Tax=Burkholderia sp. SIMBA_062 TaxID=3085803 RepID=UPI00397D61AE